MKSREMTKGDDQTFICTFTGKMKESSGLQGALMKPGISKLPIQPGDKICCFFFFLFVCLQEKFGSTATT